MPNTNHTSTFRMTTQDEFLALRPDEQATIRVNLHKCRSGKHLVHIRLAELQLGDTGAVDLWLDSLHVCRYQDEHKYKNRSNLGSQFHFCDVDTLWDTINGKL